jgi:hypothetical protein
MYVASTVGADGADDLKLEDTQTSVVQPHAFMN